MSNSKEFRYIIDVNPDHLNTIEEAMKRMEDLTGEDIGDREPGQRTDVEKKFEEVMEAISDVDTTYYGGSTYYLDEPKLNEILKIVRDTQDVSLAIASRLGLGSSMEGIDVPDDFDFEDIDLFQLSESLAEFNNTLTTGGFDPRLTRDEQEREGGSRISMSLSTAAIDEISSAVTQTDIIDRVDRLMEQQEIVTQSLFSDRAQEGFMENAQRLFDITQRLDDISELIDARDDLFQQIEAMKETMEEDPTETQVSKLEDMQQQLQELNKEILEVSTERKSLETERSRIKKGFGMRFKDISQKGSDVMRDVMTEGNIPSDIQSTVIDLFDTYIEDLSADPEELRGIEDINTKIVDNFISALRGQETEDFSPEDLMDRIQSTLTETVQQKLRTSVKNLPEDASIQDRMEASANMGLSSATPLMSDISFPEFETMKSEISEMGQIASSTERLSLSSLSAINNRLSNVVEEMGSDEDRESIDDIRRQIGEIRDNIQSLQDNINTQSSLLENVDGKLTGTRDQPRSTP